MKAIFQKHFETQFKPLPIEKVEQSEPNSSGEDVESEREGDGWEGFSSEEEIAPVQIVDYGVARTTNEDDEDEDDAVTSAQLSKKELKAFLSGKVPISSTTSIATSSSSTKKKDKTDEDDADKINLKHDLALQRLLSESHLLNPTASSNLEASGKNRLRALDIRMQSLGAKSSTFDGGKMPMNMRKGITAHRTGLEVKRRSDARENGIILEREKRKREAVGKRERGIEGHSVGRYKGGMLTLSKRDVRSIEGPRERGRGGKRGGRGGGRGGGKDGRR
jgi:hypothetical protein